MVVLQKPKNMKCCKNTTKMLHLIIIVKNHDQFIQNVINLLDIIIKAKSKTMQKLL